MNRIKSLHIHNFKFFQDEEPIMLGGNHMLLYGENGSGKSSIFWALYTLFEASLKPNDAEIVKYFSRKVKREDSLVNIHAQETTPNSDDFNSFIEVSTDDTPPKVFRASIHDIAIRNDVQAQFTNYASDFINYRLLMGLSSFRHSDKIDLFEMFVDQVFKYVQFAQVSITRNNVLLKITNAFEIWQQIELGPEMIDSLRSARPRRIRAYKGSDPYKEFEKVVNSFNSSLKSLVNYINIHAPLIFAQLGYGFQFSLQLETKAGFHKGDVKYSPKPFVLRLNIPQYENVASPIEKPHSFLNEAKLSAIAIAIRLAILSQKLNENCLKFLVLDDLLISLDMRNRGKVLDLLLSPQFSNNFQLVILTHDRAFYQYAKHKIKDYQQENWVYFEMFCDTRTNGTTRPRVIEEVGYLGKANYFLAQHELEVSGNFLRKEAESFCKNLLPHKSAYGEDGRIKALSSLIVEAGNFATQYGMDESFFKILDGHREFVLNSSSHDSYDVPKYREEIEECLGVLVTLRRIKIKVVIQPKTKLSFELSNGVDTFRVELTVCEDLKLIKEPNRNSFLPKVLINYDILKNGIKTQPNTQHGNESIESIYKKLHQWSDGSKSPDFWDVVAFDDGGALLSSIRVY